MELQATKTAPRILIFSMAMFVDYLSELISIATCAPQFIAHNKLFLASLKYYNILGKVLRFIKIDILVTFINMSNPKMQYLL